MWACGSIIGCVQRPCSVNQHRSPDLRLHASRIIFITRPQNEILGRFDRGNKRSNAARSLPTIGHHASTVADNHDPQTPSSPPGESEVVADLTADQMSVGQEDGHPSGFIFGLEPLEDTRRAVRKWMAAIACDSDDARDTSGECGHAGTAPDTAHALLLLQLFYEVCARVCL